MLADSAADHTRPIGHSTDHLSSISEGNDDTAAAGPTAKTATAVTRGPDMSRITDDDGDTSGGTFQTLESFHDSRGAAGHMYTGFDADDPPPALRNMFGLGMRSNVPPLRFSSSSASSSDAAAIAARLLKPMGSTTTANSADSPSTGTCEAVLRDLPPSLLDQVKHLVRGNDAASAAS